MNATYLNAIRDHGQGIITHIGLVDDQGAELTGGSPAYARQAVTWVDDGDGISRPNANLTFNVPGGSNVAGWRGYSASTAGTDYGGAALTQEDYTGQGIYTLLAASTSITHAAP
jgi:hypothetical protein